MTSYNLNSLQLMKTRIDNRGGAVQQARMIKDKRRSLDKAILYSYQGANIRRINEDIVAPGLINPNQIKQDYDEKILSIGNEYGYQPGDIFEWVNTGTKWLIYLQELTELAYFRGNIRRCSYEISWEDKNGERHITYAAVRGPQEQQMAHLQKNGISLDLPNYSLCLLLPNTEEIVNQFQRYNKFYLQGINNTASKICWRVEAIDSISTPNILEVYASEYYSNEMEDDIEAGIVGGLIPLPEEVVSDIQGEGFIKPKKTYKFEYIGIENAEWIFDNSLPIEVTINNKEISIKWLPNYSGQFVLQYGSTQKTIVVESLY